MTTRKSAARVSGELDDGLLAFEVAWRRDVFIQFALQLQLGCLPGELVNHLDGQVIAVIDGHCNRNWNRENRLDLPATLQSNHFDLRAPA